MLDETLEFQGYKDYTRINKTILLKKDDNGRIKLNGIRRILTIMARGYLEEQGYFPDENGERSIKYQKEDHKAILDAVNKTVKKLDKYFGSLKKGMSDQPDREKKKKNEDEINKELEETIGEKCRIWNSEYATPYSTLKSRYKNSIDMINFPLIVSEAAQEGPLKRYVLKIKDKWWKDISYQNMDGAQLSGKLYFDHETKYKLFDEEGNPEIRDEKNKIKKNNCANAQRVMKWLCCYLLGKEKTGKEDAPINLADLYHWMHYGKKCMIRYRINKVFMNEFEPELIEVSEGKEFEENEEGYLYYEEYVTATEGTEDTEGGKEYLLRKIKF